MENPEQVSEPEQPPVIGLIALDRDVVVERDLHALIGDHATLVTTRIPLAEVGSRAALLGLIDHIPSAVALLGAASPTTIAFGCTSGVAALGVSEIRRSANEVLGGVSLVDPLSMIVTGLRSLDADSISLVTPYAPEISGIVSWWLTSHDITVVSDVRIDAGTARHYAEISEEAVERAVMDAVDSRTRAVVIACTDLKVLDLIERLEDRTGIPVLSSNQALGMAAARAAGVQVTGVGRLFTT